MINPLNVWRRRPVALAVGAWLAVAGLAALVALEYLMYPRIYDRVAHGGEAAVQAALWSAIDFVFVLWTCEPQLAFLIVGSATASTWHVVIRRQALLRSSVARGVAICGAIVASIAMVVLLPPNVPVLFAVVPGGLCETTTFEEAVSPNGRYVAAVVEVDCGAMSSTHRQVRLTRRPYAWTSTSILYFRGQSTLHLSWSGRTLTIRGDRSIDSMAHPPPDPMLLGGVVARYTGLEK